MLLSRGGSSPAATPGTGQLTPQLWPLPCRQGSGRPAPRTGLPHHSSGLLGLVGLAACQAGSGAAGAGDAAVASLLAAAPSGQGGWVAHMRDGRGGRGAWRRRHSRPPWTALCSPRLPSQGSYWQSKGLSSTGSASCTVVGLGAVPSHRSPAGLVWLRVLGARLAALPSWAGAAGAGAGAIARILAVAVACGALGAGTVLPHGEVWVESRRRGVGERKQGRVWLQNGSCRSPACCA